MIYNRPDSIFAYRGVGSAIKSLVTDQEDGNIDSKGAISLLDGDIEGFERNERCFLHKLLMDSYNIS